MVRIIEASRWIGGMSQLCENQYIWWEGNAETGWSANKFDS